MTRRKTSLSPITNHKALGFTLVELAIVIVIIGLLVGGVMQGAELINRSKINKEISDLNSYKSAHEMFKAKYNCMAGDCINTSMFIDQTTCNGLNTYVSTCSGDGNGKYDTWLVGGMFEGANYWVQLYLTKMLKQCSHTSNDSTFCTSNFSDRFSHYVSYGTARLATGPLYNYIVFAETYAVACNNACPSLKPEDAYAIDIKLDDGQPNTGVYNSFLAGSPSGACLSGTNYDLTNPGLACYSTFKLD